MLYQFQNTIFMESYISSVLLEDMDREDICFVLNLNGPKL